MPRQVGVVKIWLFLFAVSALGVGLVGCGSQQDDRATVSTQTPSAVRGEQPKLKDEAHRWTACRHASFSLGKLDGEIDFHMQCSAGAEDTHRVFVARSSSSHPGLRSDIRHVSRSPKTSGSAAEVGQGICKLNRGIALCRAPRGVAVALEGRISVPPGLECARKINAYVVLPSRCDSRACNLDFAVESLFRGRPRGCSGVGA